MRHFDGDIIGDVYDLIFKNDHHIGTDFVNDFQHSYVDHDNARIHLVNDHENYEAIMEAYDNQEWEQVIDLEGCRYCKYDFEDEWIVEEIA